MLNTLHSIALSVLFIVVTVTAVFAPLFVIAAVGLRIKDVKVRTVAIVGVCAIILLVFMLDGNTFDE